MDLLIANLNYFKSNQLKATARFASPPYASPPCQRGHLLSTCWSTHPCSSPFPHLFVGWNPTAAQAMKTQRTTPRRIKTMTSSRRVSFQTAFLWRMKATSLFTFRCLVKR